MRWFSNLGFRTKLACSIIPLILLASALSVYLASQQWQEMSKLRDIENAGNYFSTASDLLHEMQRERGKSMLYLGGKIAAIDIESQRLATDTFLLELKNNEIMQRLPDHVRKWHDGGIASLKNFRTAVDQKITAAEALAIINTANRSMISALAATSSVNHYDNMSDHIFQLSMLEMAKESAGKVRASLIAVASTDAPVNAAKLAEIAELRAGVLTFMEFDLSNVTENGRKELIATLKSPEWASVVKAMDTIIVNAAAGNFGIDSQTLFTNATTVIDQLKNLISSENGVLSAAITSRSAELRNFMTLQVSVVALLLTLLAGISWMIARDLGRHLERIANVLQSDAESISSSAEQLKSSSDSVASSTSEQAAAAQETAAAVEEVSAMVLKNTENAQMSRSLSGQSKENADEGSTAMREMVTAIGDIASSNREILTAVESGYSDLNGVVKIIQDIGAKTKVINEIVFQTKLLSFNASVEAARAGEHGKGFAVVADEVGNLAQMSGTAANDIRALLGDSIQRVEQVVSSTRERVQGLISSGAEKVQSGTALAERCKTTLDKIAGAVNQVDERVQEIAVASGEQNRGVSEISKAIGELDTATQQNSTAVQEVASASAQLANQASSLATLVGDLYSLVRGKGTSGSVSTSVQTTDSGTKSLARLSRKFRQKNNVTNEENGAGRNQKAA